jgi:hypothetical protein
VKLPDKHFPEPFSVRGEANISLLAMIEAVVMGGFAEAWRV